MRTKYKCGGRFWVHIIIAMDTPQPLPPKPGRVESRDWGHQSQGHSQPWQSLTPSPHLETPILTELQSRLLILQSWVTRPLPHSLAV